MTAFDVHETELFKTAEEFIREAPLWYKGASLVTGHVYNGNEKPFLAIRFEPSKPGWTTALKAVMNGLASAGNFGTVVMQTRVVKTIPGGAEFHDITDRIVAGSAAFVVDRRAKVTRVG